MGLNAKKAPKGDGGGFRQPPIENGTYPARIVQIIDLGVQARDPWKGKEKPPIQMISITYELLDEFCVDEDGNELEDKPRWISETFPLYNLEADRAKSTQRYLSLDPKQDHDGDFTALVNLPCMVTVVQNVNGDKVYANVGNVAPMRAKEAGKAEELQNPPVVFLLDDPDLEVFEAFPDFIKDKIKANVEYDGSALYELLNGKKGKAKAVKKDEPEPDEGEQEGEEEGGDDDQW